MHCPAVVIPGLSDAAKSLTPVARAWFISRDGEGHEIIIEIAKEGGAGAYALDRP